MFDNLNNIIAYEYKVQLDSIVTAISEISFDIGKQLEHPVDDEGNPKDFTIQDLFKKEFLNEIGIRYQALADHQIDGEQIKGYTSEEFFSLIASYYSQKLFYTEAFLTNLENSDILFVDKRTRRMLGGDRANQRLIPALKKTKILKNLISNLKSEGIQKSLEKIELFENDIFYKDSISVNKIDRQPILPFVPIGYINTELVDEEIVDTDKFWLNVNGYKKLKCIIPAEEAYQIIKLKGHDDEVGIRVGEILLSHGNYDLLPLLKEDKINDYLWMLLQYTYTTPKPGTRQTVNDALLETFKAERTNPELNKLLSYLKNNFYINNAEVIGEEFKPYFNQVLYFEKLEHLDSYQFMMSSSTEEETALGVYTSTKVNNNYNLLHWLNHKNEQQVNHFRSVAPAVKKKSFVHTLKPSISYYFLEKYFEDLVEQIIKAKCPQYLANRNFVDKNTVFAEVDFLINNNGRLVYIETKTKITKRYIEDFLKKASKMLDRFKPIVDKGAKIEFVLIGGYSDSSVEDFRYFIDTATDKTDQGYNKPREGLNSKPFYFSIPIPDKEGQQILCIAEPEYDKLENLLSELCPE